MFHNVYFFPQFTAFDSNQSSIYNLSTYDVGNQQKFQYQDGRKQVIDFNSYPYNTIGKIVVEFQTQAMGKVKSFGTGTQISHNYVLTSAHVVDNNKQKIINRTITFYPFAQEKHENKTLKGFKVLKIHIHPEYFNLKNNRHQRYDMALLQLQSNSKTLVKQTLKIQFDFTFWSRKQQKIAVVGYSSDKQYKSNTENKINNKLMMEQRTACRLTIEPFLEYYHTTSSGNSGGPVWIRLGNEYKLIGIHKGSQPNKQPNYCLLINNFPNTQEIFNEIIQKNGLQQQLFNVYKPTMKRLQQENKRLNNQLKHKTKLIQGLTIKNNQLQDKLNKLQKQLKPMGVKNQQQKEQFEMNVKQANTFQKLIQNQLKHLEYKQQKTEYLLDLSGKSLINLDSIMSFKYVNLRQLGLWNNKLIRLPAINAPQLQKLWCHENQITEIQDFAQFEYSHLNQLRLNDNKLTRLHAINAPQLQILLCKGNQIKEIEDFAKFEYSQLKQLGLSNNKLTRLPAINAPQLQILECHYNQITEIKDFANFEYNQLKQLGLCNNKLPRLPAINAPQLQGFGCFKNQITEIEDFAIFEYSHLKSLYLSSNKLKSIPKLNTIKLQFLDLSTNDYLVDLQRFAEGEYPCLKLLKLTNTNLPRIPVLKAKELKQIWLHKNHKTMIEKQIHCNPQIIYYKQFINDDIKQQ